MKGINHAMAKAGLSQCRIGFDRSVNACYIGGRRSASGTGFSPNTTVLPVTILTLVFLIYSDYRWRVLGVPARWEQLSKIGPRSEKMPLLWMITKYPHAGEVVRWLIFVRIFLNYCSNKYKICYLNCIRKTAIFSCGSKIAKKKIIRFRHVCPSVRPHGTPRLLFDGFSLNLIPEYILKICRENEKSDKNEGYFLYVTHLHLRSHVAEFFLEWELFQTKFLEKIKEHIFYSIKLFFLRKSCLLWDNVETCCTAGQATDDNMAHAHCMLDT